MYKELKLQLEKGIKVEMEHTKSRLKAKEIAMDHLFEDPKYYDKLKKIEVDEEEGHSKYYPGGKTPGLRCLANGWCTPIFGFLYIGRWRHPSGLPWCSLPVVANNQDWAVPKRGQIQGRSTPSSFF
jgi:hypothetical protein